MKLFSKRHDACKAIKHIKMPVTLNQVREITLQDLNVDAPIIYLRGNPAVRQVFYMDVGDDAPEKAVARVKEAFDSYKLQSNVDMTSWYNNDEVPKMPTPLKYEDVIQEAYACGFMSRHGVFKASGFTDNDIDSLGNELMETLDSMRIGQR